MIAFLRTFFCILAVLCVGATIPLAIFLGTEYCLIAVGGAVVFALLMIFMKNGAFATFKKQKKTDFMNTDEVNAEILRTRQDHEE